MALNISRRISITEKRLGKFTDLKEEFSKGDFHRLMDPKFDTIEDALAYEKLIGYYGYELNDIIGLRAGVCPELEDVVPEDLRQEAVSLVEKSGELASSSGNDEDYYRKNQQEYIKLFERCENAEKKLHQILLTYKENPPEKE